MMGLMTKKLVSVVAEPVLRHVVVNGVSLAYFEWRADLQGVEPTLLMVHATGFHARVWDQVIAALPARHVIALEQRGHGRSQTTAIANWSLFADDLCEFVDVLALRGVIGIGHSMGAHVLVRAAARDSARSAAAFSRLLLIDPVILSPEAYRLLGTTKTASVASATSLAGAANAPNIASLQRHPAARRVNHFASAQAMFERFAQRGPYAVFDPQVLRDYCTHGLQAAPQGQGFVLACDPITEASIYSTARDNADIFDSVRAVPIPVLIVRAKLPAADRRSPDFASSPTWPGLVDLFANGRERHLSDQTHLVPMQSPHLIGQLIRQELAL